MNYQNCLASKQNSNAVTAPAYTLIVPNPSNPPYKWTSAATVSSPVASLILSSLALLLALGLAFL